MTNQEEKEYYLKVLVEYQLYPYLKVLEEANIPDLEKKKKKVIEDFINNLQSQCKELQNRDKIIRETLIRMKEYNENEKEIQSKNLDEKDIER